MEITARKKKCYLTEIEEKKYKKKKKNKKKMLAYVQRKIK